MADKNHHYATKLLHHYGFATRSDVTSKFVGWDKAEDIGRADIFASRRNMPVFVEVKRGIDAFDTTQWRVPQRIWAEWMESAPFNTPYWLYLTIGKNPPNYNPDKYMPRKSWLIPRAAFLEVEKKSIAIQNRLVYRAAKGMRKEIQEGNIDACTLLSEWELVWNANDSLHKPSWMRSLGEPLDSTYGGFWTIPTTHSFYSTFLSDITESDMLEAARLSSIRYQEQLAEYKASQPVKAKAQKKSRKKKRRK